jgi:hypothetical protein
MLRIQSVASKLTTIAVDLTIQEILRGQLYSSHILVNLFIVDICFMLSGDFFGPDLLNCDSRIPACGH